jgi:hypothetical protein
MSKLSVCLTNKHYAMKMYEEVNIKIQVFFILALVRGEWLASRSGRFTPGKVHPVSTG